MVDMSEMNQNEQINEIEDTKKENETEKQSRKEDSEAEKQNTKEDSEATENHAKKENIVTEETVKELIEKYTIKGYLTEAKIRSWLSEVEDSDDADSLIHALYEEACRKREQAYQNRVANYENASTIQDFENVKETLEALDGYKDSEQLAMECQKKADALKQKKAEERKATEAELEKELKAVYAKDKKQVKWLILGMIALIIICSVILLWMGERILLM